MGFVRSGQPEWGHRSEMGLKLMEILRDQGSPEARDLDGPSTGTLSSPRPVPELSGCQHLTH